MQPGSSKATTRAWLSYRQPDPLSASLTRPLPPHSSGKPATPAKALGMRRHDRPSPEHNKNDEPIGRQTPPPPLSRRAHISFRLVWQNKAPRSFPRGDFGILRQYEQHEKTHECARAYFVIAQSKYFKICPYGKLTNAEGTATLPQSRESGRERPTHQPLRQPARRRIDSERAVRRLPPPLPLPPPNKTQKKTTQHLYKRHVPHRLKFPPNLSANAPPLSPAPPREQGPHPRQQRRASLPPPPPVLRRH